MNNQIKYKANPVVSFKDEGNEGAVLYNPDTDKCVILNPVGAAVWLYLENPKTLDEIVLKLNEEFSGVDDLKAQEDLIQFIGSFGEDFICEMP